MPLFSMVNFIIFQIAWFTAALLRDDSIIVLVLLLIVHGLFSPSKNADLCTVLLLLPVGMVSEMLMISTGLLSYQSELALPIWMILLWIHLCLSVNHSLVWMKKTPVIWQSVLAALAGTGSYAAASGFGAINWHNSQVISLLVIALIWAIQLPLMMKLTQYVKQRNLACSVYE